MAGFVHVVFKISLLYFLVCTNRYLNAERLNALPDNVPQPLRDIFVDEQEEDVIPESFVSTPQFDLRSASTDLSNLKVAAFNVRIFGKKKMATPGVSEILVEIILRYDVILIQEVRDASKKAIRDLLLLVNRTSKRGQYNITISPRLGRTSSKEQYAFLYRRDVLSVKKSYVYDDGQESLKSDTFEREPYIVQFSSTFTNITDFVLVAIHTSPKKAPQEIDELVNVYDDVTRQLKIPDVVILGDLNAACRYMKDSDWEKNRLANDKRFHWLISDSVDTTVAGGHCAYDRFVVAGDAMLNAMIKSSAGSFEFDQVLGLNKNMALEVSDHYPVEIQVYSKRMATAVSHVAKTVVYTFRMKQPADVSERKLCGLRKIFSAFTVTTTYTKSKAISRITFSKTVQSKEEALNAILYIKDKALRENAVSQDQIQLAEFQIKGAWDEKTKLSGSGSGVVKLVCEMYPSPSCWIAMVLNQ